MSDMHRLDADSSDRGGGEFTLIFDLNEQKMGGVILRSVLCKKLKPSAALLGQLWRRRVV